jgi:hypothetical protein
MNTKADCVFPARSTVSPFTLFSRASFFLSKKRKKNEGKFDFIHQNCYPKDTFEIILTHLLHIIVAVRGSPKSEESNRQGAHP